ncbi:MAG: hypothetical protein JWL84_313 [Rhodospirillales bacterium]|nr:hypothetical protein [Rhodospirillales bacterium]
MRSADRNEALAMTGLPGPEALRRSATVSRETWAGTVDGVAACVFGLGMGSMLDDVGRPWMVGTPLVERHSMAFLRRNRPMIARWLEECRILENWVDARHAVSRRWLNWLGFRLDRPAPHGPWSMPFHRFEMLAP